MNDLQTLLNQLRAGPVFVRARAVNGLVDLGEEARRPMLTMALDQTLEPVVRCFAAGALARLPAGELKQAQETLDALTSLLDDDHVTVARAAAGALGALGNPAALPSLKRHQGDDRPDPEAWFQGDETVGDAVEGALVQLRMAEIKSAMAAGLRRKRQQRNLTQQQVATQIGSSQSRIAKMEAADPSVSMDLMIRGLLILGASRQDFDGIFLSQGPDPTALPSDDSASPNQALHPGPQKMG